MAQIIFKRKLYDKMLEWKRERNGETALLIKGARRVGKSTLAEHFAQNEYKSYILINFADESSVVSSWFDDISDLDDLFMKMQYRFGVTLYEGKSAIIFDEVQMCPKARQSIKKLVKDNRYHYIETGSLISIKKNVKDILIPSEETRVTLNPMDFEEFRWALGDEVTLGMLRQSYSKMKSLSDDINRKLMRDFRLYMLVGGMPQAVSAYLKTNNMSLVDKAKRDIIELYADDFRKIDNTGRATRMFYAIPAQLSKNASRYQVSSVIENGRSNRVSALLQDMEDSQVINIAYHANDPSMGLSLHEDYDQYKIFLADTGLFITLAFWDKDFTENVIYEKLLSDKLGADLGYVFENIVAQMLVANGNKLYYHTWPTEDKKHNYEIDFLLSSGNKIFPLEVKSSGYKSHASLDAFQKKYSERIGKRFLVYTKDLRKDEDVILLPVYMTGLI